MDIQTREFLSKIGLENLLSHFEEQEISFDVLESINKEELAELVPKIGNRVKIRKALTEHKDSKNNAKDIQEAKREIERQKEAVPMKIPEEIEMNIKFEALDEQNACSSSGIPQEVEAALALFSDENIDEDIRNERMHTSLFLNQSQHMSISASHELLKKSFTFENNLSLEGYLQASAKGRLLMRSYSINNSLTNTDRRSLTDIIVNGILEQQDSVQSSTLEGIAQEIVDLFPTERKEIYFFKSPLSKISKGKLSDKYKNLRKIRSKFIPRKNKHDDRKMIIPGDEPIEPLQDSYFWLLKNAFPWEDVEYHWKKTFPIRCHHHNQKSSLNYFLDKWPILNNHHSYKLVENDFELLHPGSSRQFATNFQKYKAILRNKIDGSVLSNSFLNADNNINEDSDWLIWSHLPRMTSTARYFDGEKCIKPSKDMAAMNFIRFISDPSEMKSICDSKQNLVKMSNNRLQHYCQIFSIQSTRKHIVRFCDIYYEFDCISRAVEVCVKLHKVCNVEYPTDTNTTYLIIQRLFFEMETHNDKMSVGTSVFVGDVRQQAKSIANS